MWQQAIIRFDSTSIPTDLPPLSSRGSDGRDESPLAIGEAHYAFLCKVSRQKAGIHSSPKPALFSRLALFSKMVVDRLLYVIANWSIWQDAGPPRGAVVVHRATSASARVWPSRSRTFPTVASHNVSDTWNECTSFVICRTSGPVGWPMAARTSRKWGGGRLSVS